MKFKVKREDFLQKLGVVSTALPVRSPMPVLTGIRITVNHDTLTMIASDTRISVRTKMTVESDSDGDVVLPGKMLYTITRALSAGYITFALTENVMKITADRGEYSLHIMNAREYPDIVFEGNGAEENVQFSLDGMNFASMVKGVMPCASTSEKKPILTGVNLKCSDGKIEAIATDSFRLAKKTMAIPEDIKFGITVPKNTLDVMIANVKEGDIISFEVNRLRMFASVNDVDFVSALMDGNYPDTTKLTTIQFKNQFKFNKNELMSAIDRITVLSPSDSGKDRETTYNVVKFNNVGTKEIMISVKNASIGDANEIVPYVEENEAMLEMNVNGKYLIDALKSVNGDIVVMNYNGGILPFTFTSEADEDSLQLLLPIRA